MLFAFVGVEVAPSPDAQLRGPVHQLMLVVNGIHLLENLKLDELAAKRVYEFALIVEPLKIQGGTGSTVAPIVPVCPRWSCRTPVGCGSRRWCRHRGRELSR